MKKIFLFFIVIIFLGAIGQFFEDKSASPPQDTIQHNAANKQTKELKPNVKSKSKLDEALDSAFQFCLASENAGMAISCNVGTGKIKLVVDMIGSEARQFCSELEGKNELNWRFHKLFDMHIISPYSNGNPIAVCTLY